MCLTRNRTIFRFHWATVKQIEVSTSGSRGWGAPGARPPNGLCICKPRTLNFLTRDYVLPSLY